MKVKIQDNEIHVRFRREELKVLFKKYNSTHYLDHNSLFINDLQQKYRAQSRDLDKLFRIEQLKQMIDIALDIRDSNWFIDIYRQF